MKKLKLILQVVGDDGKVTDLSKSEFPVKKKVESREHAFHILKEIMIRVNCDLVNELSPEDDSPEVREALKEAQAPIQKMRDRVCDKMIQALN